MIKIILGVVGVLFFGTLAIVFTIASIRLLMTNQKARKKDCVVVDKNNEWKVVKTVDVESVMDQIR